MFQSGIKASELIKKLKDMIDKHGDREVIVNGGDCPEPCSGVILQKDDNNPYVPKGMFKIY